MAMVLSKEEYQLHQQEIDEVISLDDRLQRLTARLSRINNLITRLESQEVSASDALVDAETNFQSAADELDRVRNDISSTADEIADAETKFINAKKEYEKAKAKRERIDHLITQSTSRKDALEDDIDEVSTLRNNTEDNLKRSLGRL